MTNMKPNQYIKKSIMMKKCHLCKATDLYDCGTATFGIAKGNIQSVLIHW
jgi:hypothetical protein